ncbi:YugN family protein [Alkalihalobacillus sp. LMS39]|uniref:YugN family protein n=1 Tax=Alkalihalobacillus sp. LMS39 TaxID=2924032 RepID=UPI001FB25B13|nr:YugN family protein [Alkalihalobacillus sp. LMS39]UOE92966.1 YugN-like family protein [Alkalihalobacillus sp. LMS39]
MKFESIGLGDKEFKFSTLQHAAESAGFIHAGQWDYERVTFDYKMASTEHNVTYFLRVHAYAIEGDIPSPDAKVKLLDPILGKHYYPHGVEYENEEFPNTIVTKSKQKLELLKEKLDQ